MTDNVNAGTFGLTEMLSRHLELRFHAFCEPNSENARLAFSKRVFLYGAFLSGIFLWHILISRNFLQYNTQNTPKTRKRKQENRALVIR